MRFSPRRKSKIPTGQTLQIALSAGAGVWAAYRIATVFPPPPPIKPQPWWLATGIATMLAGLALAGNFPVGFLVLAVLCLLVCGSTLDLWFGQVHDIVTCGILALVVLMTLLDQTFLERLLFLLLCLGVGGVISWASGQIGGADIILVGAMALLLGFFGFLSAISVALLVFLTHAAVHLAARPGSRQVPFFPALSVGMVYVMAFQPPP